MKYYHVRVEFARSPFEVKLDLTKEKLDRTIGLYNRLQELAQRLQAAGCPVNLEGTDWHTVGNLNRSYGDSELELIQAP